MSRLWQFCIVENSQKVAEKIQGNLVVNLNEERRFATARLK
jgi:hypothetical protein